MRLSQPISAQSIVDACGDFSHAAQEVVAFSRSLWHRRFTAGSETHSLFDTSIPKWLEDADFEITDADLQPLTLARQLLSGLRPDHDVRYYVWRAIRRHYGFVQSSQSAHRFHRMSRAANKMLAKWQRSGVVTTMKGEVGRRCYYQAELAPVLANALLAGATNPGSDASTAATVALFVECCRVVDYVRAIDGGGEVLLRAGAFDAEFLLSNCFGMPSGVRGLDALFGGGGLTLLDAGTGSESDRITGRTVLTVGPFGTGKSLLALQFAFEVARKGGVAWIMALEQTPEECLYALESIRPLPDDGSIFIAKDVARAQQELSKQPTRGGLIFLRTVKDSYEDFLGAFDENVQLMSPFPLRLMIVDPISAIAKTGDATLWRRQTLDMFERAKARGTNVWLIEEETSDEKSLFERNIADTVIRLSSVEEHGYAQRYIEVLKSRLQREHRGRHALTITPGEGLTVYPASASVSARIQNRSIRNPDTAVRFGFPELDAILGEDAIKAGDVIVLKGPRACHKTPLGLRFLLEADEQVPSDRRQDTSLLLAARESEPSLRQLLTEELARSAYSRKSSSDVSVYSLRGGYVKPGYILQRIEDEILHSARQGRHLDRVMIDNIGHWDTSCPFIAADKTFGDTLVDLLRRRWVTSLITCGEYDSPLQQAVVDNADCLIEFHRVEFRGVCRVMLRVVKSRVMGHQREMFEVARVRGALDIKPASPLLRVAPSGEVSAVKIRLFLHAETDMQYEYNERIKDTIQSVLSPEAHIEAQSRMFMRRGMELGFSSAVDELQLLQIDEFQVPRRTAGSTALGSPQQTILHQFSRSEWDEDRWQGFIPRLAARIRTVEEDFIAVPFYENVSLLAYREGAIDPAKVTWKALAKRAEQQHRDDHSVFFEFAGGTIENYNCLFFEILLALSPPPSEAHECPFRAWLRRREATDASVLFRQLCRPAHLARLESRILAEHVSSPKPAERFRIDVNCEAQVWRHWYGTLNQMLSESSLGNPDSICVCPLPGMVSIAGEWYLGIPAYSAATDVGLAVIKLLTSREAELDRVQLGVGLPTRESFYSVPQDTGVDISPYFHGTKGISPHTLGRLVAGAFERSRFACYPMLSGPLYSHLRRILESPEPERAGGAARDRITSRIRTSLASLEAQMDFLSIEGQCRSCPARCGSPPV